MSIPLSSITKWSNLLRRHGPCSSALIACTEESCDTVPPSERASSQTRHAPELNKVADHDCSVEPSQLPIRLATFTLGVDYTPSYACVCSVPRTSFLPDHKSSPQPSNVSACVLVQHCPTMDAELIAPNTLTALVDGYTTNQEITFWVRCHDRHLQNITIVDNDGEKLFYVEGRGAYKSWTFRRPVKDPSGNPVFDLRRYGMDIKMRWFVDDASGIKIAELSHKSFFTRAHTAIDAQLFKEDVRVEMRPRDFSAATTYVNVHGSIIAEISLHMGTIYGTDTSSLSGPC